MGGRGHADFKKIERQARAAERRIRKQEKRYARRKVKHEQESQAQRR